MSVLAPVSFASVRRRLAWLAGLAAAVTLGLGWVCPAAIGPAYRFGLFLVLAPAIGSLLFGLVHACTGGRWGDTLRPFFAAGGRLAPWLWLGIVPLLLAAPATTWTDYDGRAALAGRALVAGLIFGGLALVLYPRDGRRPEAWVGPLGLIVLVFTLHLLAHDWLGRLEPGWQSTAFPLVWMLGQAVAGLACAILAGLSGGLSPRAESGAGGPAGIDWGNLLLTASLLWCYVMFAQFLIIWSANLPREISWFVRRLRGGWAGVPVILALLHFVLPLALLLSRRAKQSAGALGLAAGLLLAAQTVFLAWAILPAFPLASLGAALLCVALATAALAAFFHRYVALAVGRGAIP